MNYYAFRIDRTQHTFIDLELKKGHLRQGWGWDKRQDLAIQEMDQGAFRNRPMLKVKKGDYVLVPHLPQRGNITIVEATEDWSTASEGGGYRFEIAKDHGRDDGDYGHIFPAKRLRHFARSADGPVDAALLQSFRSSSRFWSLNKYAEHIEVIMSAPEESLQGTRDYSNRFMVLAEEAFSAAFKEETFREAVKTKFNAGFFSTNWEYALEYGLSRAFPFYNIERVGGKEEKNHGADLKIEMPSPFFQEPYVIAIQVKDYKGAVGPEVITQINKSDGYWEELGGQLIQKVIIITGAVKEDNIALSERAENVTVIYADELLNMLEKMVLSVVLKENTNNI